MRGQVNMEDEAKLCNSSYSTFEALVVRCAVRRCGEEYGPFCWPLLAVGVAVLVHLTNLLSILLRCNGFTRIQKDAVDQMGSRPPTVTMTFIGCKFGFGRCFGASSWSSHWAGCCWLLYKIHFSLHITIWLRNGSLLLCTAREDDTSKWWFFWLAVSSWGTHLSNFFNFPVCFKC